MPILKREINSFFSSVMGYLVLSTFLLNAVNYLLYDSGLINIRTKEIVIPFLDPQKTATERTKWQAINVLLPLGFLALFGLIFVYFRRKKYAKAY